MQLPISLLIHHIMFGHQTKQSGAGLFSPYAGHQYQRGNGFFSNVMKKGVLPFLRYIGLKGLGKFNELASEAVRNPDEFKAIAKRKLREMAGEALEDGGKRAKKFIQTGEGIPIKISHPYRPTLTTSSDPLRIRFKPNSNRISKRPKGRQVKKGFTRALYRSLMK
jgi:hypothetical protein